MTLRRMSLNFLLLSSMRGLDIIVPLFLTPYLVKTLGIEKFGTLVFGMSIAAYLGVFIRYGFGITGARNIARLKENPEKACREASDTFGAMCLMFLVTCILLIIGLSTVKLEFELEIIIGLAFLVVAAQSLIPTWLYVGIDRMSWMAIASFVTKLSYVVLVVSFVNNPSDYIWVYAYYGSVTLVYVVLSLFTLRYVVGFSLKAPSISSVVDKLKEGRRALFIELLPQLYNNTTLFLLGATVSPSVLGAFSAAQTFVEAVMSLGRIASSVALPIVAEIIAKHQIVLKFFMFVGIGFTLLLAALARPISELFYSESAVEVAQNLTMLAPGIMGGYLFLALNNTFLMLVGLERETARIISWVCVFFLVLSIFMVPAWGAFGAAMIITGARLALAGSCFYVKRALYGSVRT